MATDMVDVLVIGGGPAGAWAALTAATAGAVVTLVEKGYCGSSGATASASTGVWRISVDETRESAIEQRFEWGGGLASREWMARVLATTAERLQELATWGYRFPEDDLGRPYRDDLRGPDYMHFLRRMLRCAGVTVMDHSPALELLMADGVAAGARGYSRQVDAPYEIRSGAVVMASGGCAFLSRALGCDVNTGDGLLMALEAGADLSGMEFSSRYGLSPVYSSVTKGFPYFWATFTDDAGNVIDVSDGRMLGVARGLVNGPVYAVFDKATPQVEQWLRQGQPNCFLPHDRLGIDPFRQRFGVTLLSEGTVRGSGGIRLVNESCAASVPGLFAAGDAASRECVVGGGSGGGGVNASWAITSGTIAGRAAAEFARAVRVRVGYPDVRPTGVIGMRPDAVTGIDATTVIRTVQDEVLPLEKNFFRHRPQLLASLARLDGLYQDVRAGLHGTGATAIRAREAAAMLTTARHCYTAALRRQESRGLHRRVDCPDRDSAQQHRLVTTGVERIAVTPSAVTA